MLMFTTCTAKKKVHPIHCWGTKSERIGVEWLFIAAAVFVHLLSMSLLSLLFVGTMTYNYIIHVTNHRLLNCLTTTDPVHHQPTIPPE